MPRKIVAKKDGHTVTVLVEGADIDVSVDGMKGPSCIQLSDQLVSSLGSVQGTEHTDEYYATESTNVSAES